jgi:hypothetical protein
MFLLCKLRRLECKNRGGVGGCFLSNVFCSRTFDLQVNGRLEVAHKCLWRKWRRTRGVSRAIARATVLLPPGLCVSVSVCVAVRLWTCQTEVAPSEQLSIPHGKTFIVIILTLTKRPYFKFRIPQCVKVFKFQKKSTQFAQCKILAVYTKSCRLNSVPVTNTVYLID